MVKQAKSATEPKVDGNLRAPFRTEVAKLLRARRNELGLTQRDLAEQAGISQQQINKYEKGADQIPADRLLRLCSFLGIDPSYVIYPLAVADGEATAFAEGPATPFGVEAFTDRDTVALVRAFRSISDKRVRKKVLRLIETMAETATDAPPSEGRKRRRDPGGSP